MTDSIAAACLEAGQAQGRAAEGMALARGLLPDGSSYDQGTTEALLQADPEVILLVGSYWGDGTDPDALDANPLWVELRAVQAGLVHVLPHDARATSIWGVGDYLDTVAPLVHPDTFPVPLTDEQVAAGLARD